MAANTTGPIWELTPSYFAPQEFTSADTTSKKTIVTGGTNGSRIGANALHPWRAS